MAPSEAVLTLHVLLKTGETRMKKEISCTALPATSTEAVKSEGKEQSLSQRLGWITCGFQDSVLRWASFVTRPVWFQSETKMFASGSMKQPCAALNTPALTLLGSTS